MKWQMVVAGVLAGLFICVMSASAQGDAVCSNLKSMLDKQKRTLKHFQEVHANSNMNLGEAHKTIRNLDKSARDSQQKIKQLHMQIAAEQRKLTATQNSMALEKARISKSHKTLKSITKQVISNEHELIGSLNQQYYQMCSPGSHDGVSNSTSTLEKKYYP